MKTVHALASSRGFPSTRSSTPSQRTPNTWVWLTFVLALLCLPLSVAPGLFLGHDVTPKLLVLIAAACVALISTPEWIPGLILLYRGPGKLFCWFVGLFSLSIALSTVCSVHLSLSLAGTIWRRYGAVTQLLVLLLSVVGASYLHHPQRLMGLLNLLVVSASLVSIYGILQYFGWDPIFGPSLYTYEYIGKVRRPPATLGHAMYMATFLLPAIFIMAGRAILATGPKRIVFLALTTISLLALFLSGTRSALLGLAMGVGFAVLHNRSRLSKPILISFGTVFVALTLATVGIGYSSAGAKFRTRIAQLMQDWRGGPRLLVWRDSLQLIREHPILGSGPDTFAGEFRRVESVELAKAYPDFYHESPHNLFLDIVIAQGFSGVIVAVAWIGVALYVSWRRKGTSSVLESGLLSAFLAMLTALQFVPLTLANAIVFYLLIGALFAFSTPIGTEVERQPRGLPRVATALGSVLLIVVAVLYAIQDSMFADLGRKIARGDFTDLAEEYQALSRLPFPKPGQDLWFSRQLASLASARSANSARELGLARQASSTAERTSEEPFNALYQSAALAIAAGDLVEAENKLTTLIRQAASWYKPHLLLGQIFILSGKQREGLQEYKMASDLAGNRRQEVEHSQEELLRAIGE